MRIELIHYRGFGRREKIVVPRLPVMIGSGPDAGIQVNDRRASPVHCLLAEDGDRLLARDLNSKYGTFVNGVRIKEVSLNSGDRVTVGRSSFVVAVGPNGNGTVVLPGDASESTLFVVGDNY